MFGGFSGSQTPKTFPHWCFMHDINNYMNCSGVSDQIHWYAKKYVWTLPIYQGPIWRSSDYKQVTARVRLTAGARRPANLPRLHHLYMSTVARAGKRENKARVCVFLNMHDTTWLCISLTRSWCAAISGTRLRGDCPARRNMAVKG